VSVPAPPYGLFAPSPRPSRHGMGTVSFALGLLVAFGLLFYVMWLGFAAVAAVEGVAQHAGSSIASAERATTGGASAPHVATEHGAATVPAARLSAPPTPSGSVLDFDQLWTSTDGNTIVVGAPTAGVSSDTGESVIRVPVTLTNNGERDWRPESTAFVGTLNRAPVAESAEGDWMYHSPIVPHTSVTLNRVFLGGPGQFALTVSTPHGAALFAGRV
jgi:hypothetical protein